jgi:DNA-binding NtrC family response regulator
MHADVPEGQDEGDTEPERRAQRRQAQQTPMLLIAGVARPGIGARVPRILPLSRGLTIGRGTMRATAALTGVLPLEDPLLSRSHLRITSRKGGCEVEDCGSLNGTFLDGRKLTKPARLADGGMLFFGGYAAVFRQVSAAALEAIEEEAIGPLGPVATISPAFSLILSKLRRLAPTDGELLLVGETGVGKEVYARAIHRVSGRRGRFVAINCAALPAELAESELFGYVRGAHSTATDSKPGLLETADGGTLFLDEIGDMPARLQAKLLRFLQDREITPLGSALPRRVDVRVLAATSRLGGDDGGSALRPDLVSRLGAEPIELPPLRERPEDIGALIAHFAGRAGHEMEPDALRALLLYSWPLNVRELEKVIGRALALSEGGQILLEHLPATVAEALNRGTPVTTRRRARVAPPRSQLEHLMREHRGNVSSVARALDRRWNVVWRWLVKHELEPERFRR